MKLAFVIATFAILSATPATAQSNNSNDEIVVTGQRLQTVLREFVGELTAAPQHHGENQLGRWNHRICPAVLGLTSAAEEQIVADQIAIRAHQVGLETQGPGCHANLVVLITPDADRLAEAIVRNMNDWVQPRATHTLNTLGHAELAAFLSSDGAVRWWHVLQTVGADGAPISGTSFDNAGAIPGAVSSFAPPGLLRATRQDFRSVIVIVDSRQAGGYGLNSLGDYLAMVSLAQLRPGADMSGYPTILNLFSAPNAPRAMTEWDLAYLDGLYHAQRNANSVRQQERQITDRMTQTLERNPDTPAAQVGPAQPQTTPPAPSP
jgi:hypothetical protein